MRTGGVNGGVYSTGLHAIAPRLQSGVKPPKERIERKRQGQAGGCAPEEGERERGSQEAGRASGKDEHSLDVREVRDVRAQGEGK